MRARLLIAAVLVGAITASGFALTPAALGSANQISIIQDPTLIDNPLGTMSTVRALGVRIVRIIVGWAQIAPRARARSAPRGFDAADPNSYPAANWARYDEMVEIAHQDGLGVDLTLSGGAPRWAEGPRIPPASLHNQFWAWRPSAQAFGRFARAVAERYSGTYEPPGQDSPLPRVAFWAIWNGAEFRRGPRAEGRRRLDGVGCPINWAEYLSWKRPRIASTMQYLLFDPVVTAATLRGDGGFLSGLLFANGRAKPAYAAYRLPLYLPVTSSRRGRSLEVWGCVRPARYAILGAGQSQPGAPAGAQTGQTAQSQTAGIQFARGSSRTFRTLRTVTINNPNNCYFDVRMKFPGSGTVRLAYTYPTDPLLMFPPAIEGATAYSRSVAIKLG